MARATEIINKILGAGMSLASMGFFIASFDGGGHPAAVIPAVLFAGGGFFLIARRERAAPALEPEMQQRMERLADAVTTVQNELTAMQERVDRLGEERDFMRQLATPQGRMPGLPAAGSVAGAVHPAAAPSPGGAPAPGA